MAPMPLHLPGHRPLYSRGGGPVLAPPGAFSMISATPSGSNVTVTWGASSGATSYTLKRGTSSGSYPTTVSTSATSPYVDGPLASGTYYYKAYAVNSDGTTAANNEVSASVWLNSYSCLTDGVNESFVGDTSLNASMERTNSFTWAFWVKWGGVGANPGMMYNGAGGGSGFQGIWFYKIGVTFEVQYFNNITTGDWWAIRTSGTTFTSGVWVHIIVSYDGSNTRAGFKIAVNGADNAVTYPYGGSAALPASTAGTVALTIGTDSGTYFGGHYDEWAFWTSNQAANIAAIYNGGVTHRLSDLASPPSWWRRFGDGDTYPTLSQGTGSMDLTMTNMESGDIVADVP